MSSAATLASPVYIQQSFDWDSTPSAYATAYAPTKSTGSSTASRSTRSSVETTTRSRRATTPQVAPSRPKSKPPVTVPTYEQTSSVRRGRCEHVGGILVTVLSKYGIGIDEFLAELDSVK